MTFATELDVVNRVHDVDESDDSDSSYAGEHDAQRDRRDARRSFDAPRPVRKRSKPRENRVIDGQKRRGIGRRRTRATSILTAEQQAALDRANANTRVEAADRAPADLLDFADEESLAMHPSIASESEVCLRRSTSVTVPAFGRVAAEPDLPNWTVERALALDGSSFVLYRAPDGRAIGSRMSALAYSGQLDIPAEIYANMQTLHRELRVHAQKIQRCVPLSSALRTFRRAPQRQRFDMPSWLECLFGATCSAAHAVREEHSMAHVPVLDLFCGIGGLSLGFKAAGFSNIVGVDMLCSATATYAANSCGHKSLCRRIEATDIKRWKHAFESSNVGGQTGMPFVMVAGPPCQPYSMQGKHYGEMDDRDMLLDTITLATSLLPKVLLIENVPPLLEDDAHHATRTRALDRLKKAGYVVDAHVHGLWNHDVPQMRRRSILFAVLTSKRLEELQPYMRITSSVRCEYASECAELCHPTDQMRPMVPWDALHDPNLWDASTDNNSKIDRQTMNSRDRIDSETTSLGLIVAGRVANTVLTTCLSSNSYQRLLIVPTSTSEDHVKYSDLRMATVTHVKLLQTFPASFVMFGHMRCQGMALANAVPPTFAYDCALTVRKCAARIDCAAPTFQEGRRAVESLHSHMDAVLIA